MSVGLVGMGTRGAALARTLNALPGCDLRWIADQRAQVLLEAQHELPRTRLTRELDDLLEDETLDAIAIATPVATRYRLARRALDAGKHVLVLPPAAATSAQAEELVRRAGLESRRLQMDHDLLFDPALAELRTVIETGGLGELYYLTVGRRRFGGGGGEGVIWEAGSEAVTMVLSLLGDEPTEVTARGGSCSGAGEADVAFCHLRFATGIEVELVLSAVEPQESVRLSAVGSTAMAVFDELDPQRTLTISDQTAEGRATVSSRISGRDAQRLWCERFILAVRSPSDSHNASRAAAAVVAVLEALQRSLEVGGGVEPIGVAPEPEPDAGVDRPAASVIPLPLRSA